MAKITIETSTDEILKRFRSMFHANANYVDKYYVRDNEYDDDDEYEEDDLNSENFDYEERLEDLDEQIDETNIRLDLLQVENFEIRRHAQNTIVCLTCDSDATDQKKSVPIDYNIGFGHEYLIEFSKGSKASSPELRIYTRRDDDPSRDRDIISGPINDLPGDLVPGARVLLRVEQISDKPEFKFIFEQQIFPDPKENVIRELSDRISQLEDKLFTRTLSE